jgi:hypothetical protein
MLHLRGHNRVKAGPSAALSLQSDAGEEKDNVLNMQNLGSEIFKKNHSSYQMIASLCLYHSITPTTETGDLHLANLY